jgi:hypothetical protein
MGTDTGEYCVFWEATCFFPNLLPEGHMRDYLAQLGNIKPTAEFSLIELLGEGLQRGSEVLRCCNKHHWDEIDGISVIIAWSNLIPPFQYSTIPTLPV